MIRNNRGSGRFIIPGDIRRREEPFICSGLPSFVTVKGGDYSFIPSLTAYVCSPWAVSTRVEDERLPQAASSTSGSSPSAASGLGERF